MTAKNDMKRLVEEIYSVRGRGDIEGTLALFGEGCTFRMVGNARLAPLTTESSGHDFRQTITQLIAAWDLSKVRTTGIYVDEDEQMVFAHREGEVRHIPSGVTFSTEFVDKIHFRDGKPVKIVEFVDTLQVAEKSRMIQIT
ncbi:nuclear transport factor 2 family protein [Rhizobium esperanzae]|uniref:Ketosteroid isomerase-like protein n=1 Tax=Rhizobium esperanzae TaxID=1967781 RepID=A0A7W6R7E8_9HYPH|nr:nuclear transport factor 2 family protein [Rhizobium esperanzae]MBB4238044.1 ketosteroid isomerase-like protein [Rhizobium esperanzae]